MNFIHSRHIQAGASPFYRQHFVIQFRNPTLAQHPAHRVGPNPVIVVAENRYHRRLLHQQAEDIDQGGD
jgi:hypothetical protein